MGGVTRGTLSFPTFFWQNWMVRKGGFALQVYLNIAAPMKVFDLVISQVGVDSL